MRGLSVVVVVSLTMVSWAEESALPKTCLCSPPQTALARAVKKGTALEIKLKLVKTVAETQTKNVTVRKIKEVDGKQLEYTEQQPVTICVMKPVGWNEVTLKTETIGVGVYDIQGKPVAWDKVAKALTKDTPVLISVEPVDPFYLQTMKSETLVIVGPPDAIFGSPRPQIITTPPGGNPAAPLNVLPPATGPTTQPALKGSASSPIGA